MKYLLIFFLSTQIALANPFDLSHEELNPATEDILLKKPEKYLRHESMIYDFNTSKGIKDQRKYTGTDKNRLAVSGLISSDYERPLENIGVDVVYLRRTERYHQIFWGFQVLAMQPIFSAITQNHRTGTNPNSEFFFKRPNDSKGTLLVMGPGVGYRFKLLLDFFQTENAFETVDVFANTYAYYDSIIKQLYRGYGLTTSYGIHNRLDSNFYYGGKLSYNVATVTRAALGNERKSDRSFALGWLALGLEFGFYF